MGNLTADAVNQLLKKQKKYFATGITLPYRYRAEQLCKLKSAIQRCEEELYEALRTDLGKSKQESYLTEIGFVLSDITHTLRNLKKWMKPVKVRSPLPVFPARSWIQKQPYGSALIMGPYNYPFQLLFEPLIAAVAAGNCAVLSPSEQTPHVSATVRRMIAETFGEEYVYCAEGGVENNQILLRGRFDTIFFTGSVNVGKIVMRAAADNLIPVTLELGGKSPVIVDDTAQTDIACERIAWGKFMNAGQTCVAPDYVFVHRKISELFLQTLQEKIRCFYGDDPKTNADYGRIVNSRHMERLVSLLEAERDSVVYGGGCDVANRYIEPTVLCPGNRDTASMREEIFGPILPVFVYDQLSDAMAYINGHEKPLALYIFSENKEAIKKILQGTSSGGVAINDTISQIINPNLPFGGVGHSGIGSYHGEAGFLTFSHQRSVLKRSTLIRIPLAYPPFTEKKLKKARKIIK